MRVTKVVLGLAGFLLMSLIFVSFQAAAHPDQSDAGIDNAPVDPNLDGLVKGFSKSGGANLNGFLQQPAHNPNCAGHAATHTG